NGPNLTIDSDEGQIEAGRGTLLPQPRLEHLYQIFSAVSYTPGKHSVKFGMDLFFGKAIKKQTALPVIYGGLVVFVPIDFAQVAGIPGLPRLSALQNFDPSLRTSFQS